MNELLSFAQAAPTSAISVEGWETAKGVMLTLSTAATMWIARTLFVLRDGFRDLRKTVVGADGQNGILSKVKQHEARLESIEERNTKIDAVAQAEKDQYGGPERREHPRRLRDTLLPPIPPVNPDKE